MRKKKHHSESLALISLQTGKFYVKRYSSQVWKQLLMFLTFYIFFWPAFNSRSCEMPDQWDCRYLPLGISVPFVWLVTWLGCWCPRWDGHLAPDFVVVGTERVAEGPQRTGLPLRASSSLTAGHNWFSCICFTGFLDRILFEEQMLKLRKPLTTTGLHPFRLWHWGALRSDVWLLICPSLPHKVPSWTAVTAAVLRGRDTGARGNGNQPEYTLTFERNTEISNT